MYRKRRWPAITAGYAAFLVALGGLTAFVHENAAPANRPAIIRAAVCFVAAIVLLHLRRYFRGDSLWEPPSDFEKALSAAPPPPKLHPEFARLREEVANALARQSSFESTLEPRLEELARAYGSEFGKAATVTQRRRPSPETLAEFISQIERRE
ncbi:MAG TPA: hypothetical protein VG651_08140 [Stellaceae bacterium]|nr:hypothetical protein [Stellaceae bacterium]